MKIALLALSLLASSSAAAGDWIGLDTNRPVWGRSDGLQFAVAPGGFRAHEPRGLIRIAFPLRPGGPVQLLNFIAVEPVVKGRRAFSELEHSDLDDKPGKRMWADTPPRRTVLDGGAERLDVTVNVEKFRNGAHVRLRLTQRSDAPGELQLVVERQPDSAPLDRCILTATMGNLARTRKLWLKDGAADSRTLYPDYRSKDFAPHRVFPLTRLHRTDTGDVLAAITTDEQDPASVFPFPGSKAWHYDGEPLTQYWLKPAGSVGAELQAVVNGRFTYWMSAQPIPGGIAFENFELTEPWTEQSPFVFGVSRRTPQELGFAYKP